MNKDGAEKVLAISGASVVGALGGHALMPDSTIAAGVGSGVLAGLVKQNWNLVQASASATTKDGTVMDFFKLPWMCAARIGGLTALLFTYMPLRGGEAKESLAIAAWLAGLSELAVLPDNTVS